MSDAVATVEAGHVWVAALVAVALLVLATLVLCGFDLNIARKLVMGADQRASTSKFQAAAWTYAICFALATLLVGHLLFADFDAGWEHFLDDGLNSDYLWLLGIPSAGLVGAKAITQTKVTTDPAAKPKREKKASLSDRIRELGSNDDDDDPQPALGDLQYLIFNVIALLYFLSAFLAHPELGLPSLPDSVIALTGVSAASYLATKAAVRNAPPKIVSAWPSTIVLAASSVDVVVSGTGFLRSAGRPMATLDGLRLAVADGATDTQLTARVPTTTEATAMGLETGQRQLRVLSPAGAPSEPYEVEVR